MTLCFLSGNLANGQFVDADIRAFAGDDSVNITGSFVSTTVRAGAGNDTIFVGGHTVAGAGSSSTAFYAGDGTDSLSGAGVAVSLSTAAPPQTPPLMVLLTL